jgi:hypothetical protein
MAKKIARIDADNMNSLFASEMERMGGVKVAQKDAKENEAGFSHDEQAFADHSEYLEVLQSALKADAGQDHDPNDKILD